MAFTREAARREIQQATENALNVLKRTIEQAVNRKMDERHQVKKRKAKVEEQEQEIERLKKRVRMLEDQAESIANCTVALSPRAT